MARNEDMVKLDNLLARAASQAKLMGLRSVVPHALFVVTHQALGGEAANRLLRESGVDAVAYCQKLFTELTAMPRVKRYEGEIPVHEATRRILERVAAAEKIAEQSETVKAAPVQRKLRGRLWRSCCGRMAF